MSDTQQQSVVQKFSQFVVLERDRYAHDDSGKVDCSLSQIARYLRFLEIIKSRYDYVTKRVTASFFAVMDNARENLGQGTLTAEEMREFNANSQFYELLHLEIVSFYLFANIALDKIAQFVEDYFGKIRSVGPVDSHYKWCKGIEKFAQEKALSVPDGLPELMEALRQVIAKYRNEEIVHFKNPRVRYGTNVFRTGDTQIGTGFLHPKNTDRHTHSPDVTKVYEQLDSYVACIIELITTNRSKSHYQLRAD